MKSPYKKGDKVRLRKCAKGVDDLGVERIAAAGIIGEVTEIREASEPQKYLVDVEVDGLWLIYDDTDIDELEMA